MVELLDRVALLYDISIAYENTGYKCFLNNKHIRTIIARGYGKSVEEALTKAIEEVRKIDALHIQI